MGLCLTKVLFQGCAAPTSLAGPALYRQIQREEAALDEASARADKAATCEERRLFQEAASSARTRLCTLVSDVVDRDALERCFRADEHARAVLAQTRAHCENEPAP